MIGGRFIRNIARYPLGWEPKVCRCLAAKIAPT